MCMNGWKFSITTITNYQIPFLCKDLKCCDCLLCCIFYLQWQDLAEAAKTQSCYWRFVLLQLSILRADIFSDGYGLEIAEIEVLLEEAAELVDESQQKNPNYYRSVYPDFFLLLYFLFHRTLSHISCEVLVNHNFDELTFS